MGLPLLGRRDGHLSGPARGVQAPLAFSIVIRLSFMVCLYGRGGRLTALFGGPPGRAGENVTGAFGCDAWAEPLDCMLTKTREDLLAVGIRSP